MDCSCSRGGSARFCEHNDPAWANSKLIECPECDGFGRVEVGCGGGCSSAYCYTYTCRGCNGRGTARQLAAEVAS